MLVQLVHYSQRQLVYKGLSFCNQTPGRFLAVFGLNVRSLTGSSVNYADLFVCAIDDWAVSIPDVVALSLVLPKFSATHSGVLILLFLSADISTYFLSSRQERVWKRVVSFLFVFCLSLSQKRHFGKTVSAWWLQRVFSAIPCKPFGNGLPVLQEGFFLTPLLIVSHFLWFHHFLIAFSSQNSPRGHHFWLPWQHPPREYSWFSKSNHKT